MFDPNDINKLKERMDIAEVISSVGITLNKKGRRLTGLCPFHNDHTPSLIVDPAKQTFFCPVCNEHGDAITFIMKANHLSYVEALKYIANIYSFELRETTSSLSNEEKRKREYYEHIRIEREAMAELASHTLFTTDNAAYQYLHSRGFTDETLKRFNIGYFPCKEQWGDAATLIHKSREAYQLQNRILFPWYSASNSIIGLSGRVIDEHTKGVAQKYINSSEKTGFIKGNNFYGINLAMRHISQTRRVVLVDGYTDAMAMHQSGVENVLAQNGTALTDAQARTLSRIADEVILCLDNDSAGIVAIDRAAQKLLPLDLKVEVLLAPAGSDPADLLHSQGEQAVLDWSQTETRNILDIALDNFTRSSVLNPYLRRSALSKLLTYLSLIHDPILHAFYIDKCLTVCKYLKEEDLRIR